jgi:hypothetical protein
MVYGINICLILLGTPITPSVFGWSVRIFVPLNVPRESRWLSPDMREAVREQFRLDFLVADGRTVMIETIESV